VFDGDVADTAKAKARPAQGKTSAAPTPGKGKPGRKRKTEPTEEEAQAQRAKALMSAAGLVKMFEQVQIIQAKKRLGDKLSAEQMDRLVEKLAYTPEETEMIAEPLAELLAEQGVDLPPELRLAGALLMTAIPKAGLVNDLERKLTPAAEQTVDGTVVRR
jgi:hypothetical protein